MPSSVARTGCSTATAPRPTLPAAQTRYAPSRARSRPPCPSSARRRLRVQRASLADQMDAEQVDAGLEAHADRGVVMNRREREPHAQRHRVGVRCPVRRVARQSRVGAEADLEGEGGGGSHHQSTPRRRARPDGQQGRAPSRSCRPRDRRRRRIARSGGDRDGPDDGRGRRRDGGRRVDEQELGPARAEQLVDGGGDGERPAVFRERAQVNRALDELVRDEVADARNRRHDRARRRVIDVEADASEGLVGALGRTQRSIARAASSALRWS